MASTTLRTALVVGILTIAYAIPLQAQNVGSFREGIKKIDPQGDFVLKVESEGTLAWVYLSDMWYALECFQKERVANNLRQLWRATGGNQIVVKDRAAKTVADFKIIGSGWKIPGCP